VLTVCCMSRRGGGEEAGRLAGWMAGGGGRGEGSIAAGVFRKGVQTTCHWVQSHDPTTCCTSEQHEGA
jgi:hypothetical protein